MPRSNGRLKQRWEPEKVICSMLEAIQTGLCSAAGCGSRNAESSTRSNRQLESHAETAESQWTQPRKAGV
eukprot:s2505_g10.t1